MTIALTCIVSNNNKNNNFLFSFYFITFVHPLGVARDAEVPRAPRGEGGLPPRPPPEGFGAPLAAGHQ